MKRPFATSFPILPMRSRMMAEKKTPAQGVEYRMLVTTEQNETGESYKTVVVLETTRLFAAFRYELAVEETISGNAIRYRITGLKPPTLSLPSSGPASFRREYDTVLGTYRFTVQGLDRKMTSFVVDIQEGRVTLKQPPENHFLEVQTK